MAMSLVKRLAYVEIEASDLERWRVLGSDVFGCEVAEDSRADCLKLRIDARPWRIMVSRSERNDLKVIGLEVADRPALQEICARLEKAGHPFRMADHDECAARGVYEMCRLTDPSGIDVEVSYGSLLQPQRPFCAAVGHSGFVTGDQGLGHLMLVVDEPLRAQQFYAEIMSFVTSDYVSTKNYGGLAGDFIFMRCNPRHHTLAFGRLPIPRRLGHLMLQVNRIDDVGLTLDRVHAHGFRQTRSIGRHVNDNMFSFYVESPSALQLECGWGGLEMAPDDTDVKLFDVTSVWGHKHL
jgi:2,3-dihydroxybiphenyl 1,2-dioxygenase